MHSVPNRRNSACNTSKQETFHIDGNVDTMHQIFCNEDLADEDGEITKCAHNYDTQKGQIHRPIPDHEIKSTQVLHGLLGSFDHFMKAVVHVMAVSTDPSEIPGSNNEMFCANSKNVLRFALKGSLHVKYGSTRSSRKSRNHHNRKHSLLTAALAERCYHQ